MTQLNFNEIMDYVWRTDHYQNVMMSYTTQTRELYSEIYISWSNNPKKIENLFNRSENEFGAYFNSAVRNNIISKSSPFYKNVIKTGSDVYDAFETIDIEIESEIDEKIEKEIMITKLQRAMLEAKLSWFERQLLLEYYSSKITYQEISDKYNLSKSYLYKLLDGTKKKIKNELK